MRVLDEVAGKPVAVCPCEAREPPLAVDEADFARFTIDPSRLADALARTFEAAGPTSALSDRCWYLGAADNDNRRVALVLGLFDDRDAMRELRALPGALPVSVDGVVCLTPTFEPSPDETLALSAIHVRVARVDTFEKKVSLQEPLRQAQRTVPLVTLSTDQQAEARAAAFRCSWPIVVTGRVAKRGANVVEINGTERRLSPRTFPLLVRLVAALVETDNGYVPMGSMRGGGGLASEGYYPSDEVHQANSRLRDALGPYRDLVEVSGGQIRLSTHPKYITTDYRQLARHPNTAVQALSLRISDASAAMGRDE